jgi:tetratricopeptide (TPR) repeat protein
MNRRTSGPPEPTIEPAKKQAAAPPVAPKSVAAARAIALVPNETADWLAQYSEAQRRLAMRSIGPRENAARPQPSREGRRRAAADLLKNANALLQSGKLVPAIPLLRRAAAADPDNPDAHYLLGTTLMRCGRPADAADALRHAVTVKPNSAPAFYAFGCALRETGRLNGAIDALQRAVALAPGMAEAYLRLGQVQRLLRLPEWRESFRRGARIGRTTTEAVICGALALTGDGKFGEAAECLRRAAARDPKDLSVSVMLAETLANLGDIEAALAQYVRVLRQWRQPSNDLAKAWIGLSRIKKLTEADRPMLAAMRAFLDQPQVEQPVRMSLLFVLGKAFDDLRDYAEAMRYYEAANAIRRSAGPFDRERFSRESEQRSQPYTREFFAAHSTEGVVDETPVLVVGMPRSGTTLVEQVLSSHARIAGAGELQFWIDQSRRIGVEKIAAIDAVMARCLADDYLALLRDVSPSADRVIDKMPFNFHYIGIIYHALPRARFIHCRRHPVDTSLSIYFSDFGGLSGFVGNRHDLVFYYRQYLRIMDHWRAVLPPERLIQVDYEAMTTEPEAQAKRLVDFCGLEWDPACLRPQDNRRVVETASLWQVRQPIYRSSLERWRRYEPWLGALRELMPPAG